MYFDFIEFAPNKKEVELIKKLGFSGICIINKKNNIKGIKTLYGIKISQKNEKELKNIKLKTDLIILDNEKLNRIAVEKALVDIVLGKIDYVTAKFARKTHVSIGFQVNEKINDLLLKMKVCKKYKCPIAILTLAKNIWEMKSSSELIGFGEALGLRKDKAKQALKLPEKFIERKKSVL